MLAPPENSRTSVPASRPSAGRLDAVALLVLTGCLAAALAGTERPVVRLPIAVIALPAVAWLAWRLRRGRWKVEPAGRPGESEDSLPDAGPNEADPNSADPNSADPNSAGLNDVGRQLRQYRDRLRTLASRLAQTEDRQRRAIAAGLHDTVGQNLATLKLRLGLVRKRAADGASGEDLAAELAEAYALLDRVIKETWSLTFELCPPGLMEVGLGSALEWLVRQFRQRHDFAIVFFEDPLPKPVHRDLRGPLFNMVRELLNNVAKHARPTRVEVTLTRHGDEMRIAVRDDGVGFVWPEFEEDPAGQGGFGLFGIRERLGLFGGRLESLPTGGRGSCVVIHLPLDSPGELAGADASASAGPGGV